MVFDPPPQVDGKKDPVSLSSQNSPETFNRCKDLVVGFFVGKKMAFSEVEKFTSNFWNLKGEVSISVHGTSAFVFEFKNSEDRKLVLELGSFYIHNRLFVIRPWSPLIEKKISEMKTIPIWVLIYGVPLHFWDNLGLSKISSYLGKPIMADEHTLNRSRLSYARICIEIESDFSYPNSIPLLIDGSIPMELPVEYQWKPPKCESCCVFGHSLIKCPKKELKTKPHWVPKKKIIKPIKENAPEIEKVDPIVPTNESVVKNGEDQVVEVQLVEEEWIAYSSKNKHARRLEEAPFVENVEHTNSFSILEARSDPAGVESIEEKLKNTEDDVIPIVKVTDSSGEPWELGLENLFGTSDETIEDNEIQECGNDKVLVSSREVQGKNLEAQRFEKISALIGDPSGKQPNRNIIDMVNENFQNSRKEKELAKLGWKDEPLNEKLGRGHRKSIKKKK